MVEYTQHAVEDGQVCRSVCEDFYEVCGDDWRGLLKKIDYVSFSADDMFIILGTKCLV